ncbi:MAG: hypothetical protein ACI4MG_08600 [Aristaeellaceae bacterium]
MTPITKNIIVVDENGNELHRTYAKRAKGLVKKGRAHFVQEDTICLTDPSGLHEEEEHMESELTTRDIFDRITQLQDQLASNSMSLDQLHQSLDSAMCYEADGIAEIVENVTNVFIHREQTLRSLLETYIAMYNDLKNA